MESNYTHIWTVLNQPDRMGRPAWRVWLRASSWRSWPAPGCRPQNWLTQTYSSYVEEVIGMYIWVSNTYEYINYKCSDRSMDV